MTANQGYFLDDLRIGQVFESAAMTVRPEDIVRFAREFDPQPFHLDDAAARDTLFGGLAASGWHTAALTMRLLLDGGAPIVGGVVGAGGEISWPRPLRPGDEIRVRSEVLAIVPSRSRPDRGRVTLRSETLNQHGEVVQVLIANLVAPRRTQPNDQEQGRQAAS